MHAPGLSDLERDVEIIMAILSNFTPDCRVRAWGECTIDSFAIPAREVGMEPYTLADRFATAVRIASIDPYRATTHNKGILTDRCGGTGHRQRFSGHRSLRPRLREPGRALPQPEPLQSGRRDVSLRAGSAAGARYRGRTDRSAHSLAKYSLELLGHPSARESMCIVACAGLAQNFAAVRSLVTTGIQRGHMKMHLTNILHQLGASEEEAAAAQFHFAKQTVSFSAVRRMETMKVAGC